MKDINDVFTTEDIIQVNNETIKQSEFKKAHPILYKIKHYFDRQSPEYINLTAKEINDSWKTAVNNYNKKINYSKK